MPRDSNTTRFTKAVAITEEDLKWIKENKGKKSAAGFLEAIIKQAKENELSLLQKRSTLVRE